MSTKSDEFLRQLRATFRVEAEEHLQAIAAGLLQLGARPPQEERLAIVERVFRAAHSLKGAARAVDFTAIEALCRSLEDTFAGWKRRGPPPSEAALDRLHRTLDAITAELSGRSPAPPAAAQDPPAAARSPATGAPAPAPPPAAPTPEETVRVSVAQLDAQLLEAEEMLAAKLTAQQALEDLRDLALRLESWRGEWTTVEPEVAAARRSGARAGAAPGTERLLAYFDSDGAQLQSLEARVAALVRTAQQNRHAIGKMVDDLLQDSKQLLLLPFATISASFPKLVRDLCRDQGKEADFTISGEATAIDKRILEQIKDPLVHLLRNSIDHGVEAPSERERRGKPARASIRLEVARANGNKVQVTVSDDGAGIDPAKVKAAALRRGMVSAEEAARMGDAEARDLVFRSDLSTSAMVTDLSGRGLGLAIVREKAEMLGGSVVAEPGPRGGTTFRMTFPASRAAFRGVIVRAGGRTLVVPTVQVERVARAKPGEVRTVEGRETVALDGRPVALAGLAETLELPPGERTETARDLVFVVLGSGERRVAFVVDEVLGEQEVLLKRLPPPLARVRNVAAATLLGSGHLAPVLDVADLLKSAREAGGAPVRAAAGPVARTAAGRTILVAEDSVTSRMLLKGILTAAGYTVKTAVDGMEAFALLRAERFDLLVTDVEMPRLDGFELTARIRAERSLAELPVVLVTALETRSDRERGVDAGANAYIVKGSFDQSNLLDAVRRLV